MSALRRRTRFATPFVLSVAACSGGKTHEPPRAEQFPGTIWHVQQRGQTCMASATNLECPKDMRCNPPPPSEAKCPPMPEGRTWVNVTGKAPGVCAVLPDGCTDRSCLGPETPCPLPMGQMLPPKFTQTFTIIQRDAGCLSIDTMECPPNVACNPPPPTKVTCPPGITPQSNVTIGMLPDGTCAVAPAGCAGADCAGAKVDCPPP